MSYTAPLKDMLFDIEHLANIGEIAKLPGFEDAGLETAQAVLEECARFNQDVVAPLNVEGDRNPSSFKGGEVATTPGFKEAFAQYVSGGWQGLQHPADFGGQGLPKTIGAACGEMLNSANMSFALCPLLSDGAIEALLTAGSDELKAVYLEKLVSGQWTGTMNLTEPQAGSDLALVRSRAEPQPDGTYKIFGTKIFITYGEHDMAENIVHLVLARVTGAPEGVKGISLFVVPKFIVGKDGSLGERNDVHCVSIEHKMGIKASPTAVLQYGDNGGAVGYIVGQENRGLEYMFIMMNSARYAVGMQGIAIAERAYQHAVAYAKDRVQSRPVDGSMNASAPIIHHPDVKRMLMTMRAYTEGCRAMASVAAAAYDAAHHHPDAEARKQNQAFYEFMVPLVKGYSTEMSLEVTSLGVQVHGGMGFIEETGAAQYYRDAKILTIYEGTTAIQANDLVGPQDGARRRADGQGHCSADREDRSRARQERERGGRGGSQAPEGRAPSVCRGGRLRRGPDQGIAQCGVRGQRALPDAGGQPGGRLAAGTLADHCRGPCLAQRRHRFHASQGGHGALLRRAHPQQGTGHPRQHRRRRGKRYRTGTRRLLTQGHVSPT